MEVLGTIITIVSLIIHIVHKINASSGYDSTITFVDNKPIVYKFTEEEKLENMNIESLTICYKTVEIVDFSIKEARLTLLNKYKNTDFYIKDVIVRKNCMYVKVMHSIPFNGRNKCFGATFSVNYMEPNNGILVYGAKKTNADEKQVFEQIASELIRALS